MEPILPELRDLEDPALELLRSAAALGAALHPITRRGVADLLRAANTYHSNLIEGRATRPRGVERALAGDYAKDPAKRALQLEALAHINVQRQIEKRFEEAPQMAITAPAFLKWIHEAFYRQLPESLRVATDGKGGLEVAIEPGELRKHEVVVGRHYPPDVAALDTFLARFSEAYAPERLKPIEQIVATAASHHRLAWIHPFTDGNGRVARLFTDAYLRRIGLGGHGLWTASRGLARRQKMYFEWLEAADAERWNDYDGRGARSERGLAGFSKFFLETCIDQVQYMRSLLEIDTLSDRIASYIERRASGGLGKTRVPVEAKYLLQEAMLRGEVARGEAPRITGLGERTARNLLKQLTDEKLLVSDSPKTPVRLGFPVDVIPYYFPQLYPEDAVAAA